MKALVFASCATLLLLAMSPGEASAGSRSSVYVGVQVGGHGGHYSASYQSGGYYNRGPVICEPPRPVYYHQPVYCPPPVAYCPPPVYHRPVYHQPVYHHQPVYRSHYQSSYRGGYSRGCDW